MTQGKEAIVDDDLFEWLNQWKWCASKAGKTFYAVRGLRHPDSGIKTTIAMHAVLVPVESPLRVDHENGDGLDNRLSNLRVATHQQNMRNRGPNRNGTSGFKGVTWNRSRSKWQTAINIDRRLVFIGRFDSAEEAARAYNAAALEHHGEFAWLNDV